MTGRLVPIELRDPERLAFGVYAHRDGGRVRELATGDWVRLRRFDRGAVDTGRIRLDGDAALLVFDDGYTLGLPGLVDQMLEVLAEAGQPADSRFHNGQVAAVVVGEGVGRREYLMSDAGRDPVVMGFGCGMQSARELAHPNIDVLA